MFALSARKIAALLASSFASLCVGCLAQPMEPDTDPANVVIETRLPGSPVAPARLVLTLTSTRRDTLRDTLTHRGSRHSRRFAYLDPRPGLSQTVITEYDLAPGRAWKMSVRLLDARDSLRMQDSGSLGTLKAFERREAVLAPAQRFASCPARFVLPERRGGLRLKFTRLQILVDGKVARDTLAPANGAFAAGEAHGIALVHDYLEQGRHQVSFRAFGEAAPAHGAQAKSANSLHDASAPATRLLYEGGRVLEAVAGQTSQTQDIVLDWQPEGDNARAANADAANVAGAGFDEVGLKVTLGRVGTVTLVAQMSGAIDF